MADRSRASRWVDVTGRIFTREEDAAARMRQLQSQFPGTKFRIHGHLVVGWCVQMSEK